jgi:hypothetical protein
MPRPANFSERITAQAYDPRTALRDSAPRPDMPYPRQSFHHPRTSIGAGSAGHWLKMAGILSPLIIGELVQDPNKRWRWIRIMAVLTAVTAEGFHTRRITRQRDECEQEHCR